MTFEESEQGKKLAEGHWLWLESILITQREMEGKLFKDAFLHGYKHGVELKEDEERRKK